MTQPADFTSFRVGGVSFPLQPTTAPLRITDPAVYYALDFWKYLLRTYVEDAFLTAARCASMPFQAIVAQQYPYLPTTTQMAENQFAFPLMCLGRTTAFYSRKTSGWEHDRGLFELLYALPPMTPAQGELLLPFLHAIAMVIREKTTQGYDPGYTPPGGSLGESPFSLTLAGVESAGFGVEFGEAEGVSHGFIEATGALVFPCIRMHGFFIERDMRIPSPNKFLGADVQLDHRSQDGTTVSDVVAFATQPAPTVTSVSPGSASAAGGTPITVTGTGFLSGAQVLFHGIPSTSLVVASSTTITCQSPTVGGTGSVDVIVVNPDGQSGAAPAAFTYT